MLALSLSPFSKSLEDCPLDEDEDAFHALGEEDEDIDQFNDDTFGAGAVGESCVSPLFPCLCLCLLLFFRR